MGYALLKLVHVLAVVVWVGGMAFVMIALRPALATLAPPQRLTLMDGVLARFLAAVFWSVLAVLVSGTWMLADVHGRVADSGGQIRLPWGWVVMAALGVVMAVVFALIRWRWYPRLQRGVAGQAWPAAGSALAEIRRWVTVNLVLGVAAIVSVLLGGA